MLVARIARATGGRVAMRGKLIGGVQKGRGMSKTDVFQEVIDELDKRIRTSETTFDRLQIDRQAALLAELRGEKAERPIAEIDALLTIATKRLKRLQSERERAIFHEVDRFNRRRALRAAGGVE
jgi:hypothetical protein